MKLAIRAADKIVGASVVLTAGILLFTLFMIGSNHRWFSRDAEFRAHFASAVGLSVNMPVQHLGFSIGQVRSIRLTDDDRVEVRFAIFDRFADRAREGSVVDLAVSPIGGLVGNQFLFLPGLGANRLEDGAEIPVAGSPAALRLAAAGLASAPPAEADDILSIITRVSTLLLLLNDALEGTDATAMGRVVLNLGESVATIGLAAAGIAAWVDGGLAAVTAQLEPTLANVRTVAEGMADPDGAVMSMLDGEGDAYANLILSLEALSGILQSLDAAAAHTPALLPQVSAAVLDLQAAVRRAHDVLEAMANNPLLRRGVPERPAAAGGGTLSRDLEF